MERFVRLFFFVRLPAVGVPLVYLIFGVWCFFLPCFSIKTQEISKKKKDLRPRAVSEFHFEK